MSLLANVTLEKVKEAYNKLGYKLYDKDMSVNIFGVRADEAVSNAFNDVVGLIYRQGDNWVIKKYAATTDPGLYWRLHPCNINGTGILQKGQYPQGFKLGLHQGKYPALQQNTPLNLYRDNNKDSVLDKKGQIHAEMAGINIHHASATGTSVQVDKWSAGCQVLASITDWNEFYSLMVASSKKYGNTFTYTLFDESEVL